MRRRCQRGLSGAARERGAALVLALMVLLGVSALALGLLSLGALEPQIARNHGDTLRARYLAEAGVEHAYAVLAATAGAWDVHLAGATCALGAVLAEATLPGLGRAYGAYTVRIRNDCQPGDARLTGVASEPALNATSDSNGKVIVASTGTVAHAPHTISVVVSYDSSSPAGQSGPRNRLTPYNWSDG